MSLDLSLCISVVRLRGDVIGLKIYIVSAYFVAFRV